MRKRKSKAKLQTRLPAGTGARFLTELLHALPEDGFKSQYLHEEILSKYCDPTTTPADARRTAAITKWLAAEARNAQTNQRLYLGDVDFGWLTYEQLCSDVKSLIERILGPVVYPNILLRTFHTNGASTRVKRSPVAALHKLQGDIHLSNSALKHYFAFASGTALSSQEIILREDSVLFTVPKKSDIDRVACKEPEANMLLQRGVGNYIRQRLLKFGINLNDQTINQRLACRAVRENLATIDLSSASDSITTQLVLHMLPWDWFSLLDDLRVKSTLIPQDGGSKVHHELEMFSSMGNGFTFELESLLFYAITRVICRRSRVRGTISVYGDDIIAPIGIVPRLTRVFHFIGFRVNEKKTHASGLFRESCGKHYHNGFDVTPFYVRREVLSLMDLVLHLNHVLEWDGRAWGCFTTPELAVFHKRWSRYVPIRLHGGIDPMDPGALVTGDFPRHRLKAVTKPMCRNDLASQTHWFMMKEHTEEDISVDPHREVSWTTVRQISCGERTSWFPYGAFP